jgi:beta-lactam-binding protein with PASTA domain
VHLTGAGSCTVTASQPGDANYNAAPEVSRTFSIAPAPCRVPKVVGSGLASAKRTLAKRHCRTGKLGYAYSRTRRKGIVISQSRGPGKMLPARSKVNLIVSRGRRR